jgi:hypothetical protein
MKAWLRAAALAGIAGMAAPAMAQPRPGAPQPRDLLAAAGPLGAADIAIVLAAVRQAVAGRRLRLSYIPNGYGPDVLMGANGRPRYVRAVSGHDSPDGLVEVVTFTEYTGRQARTCDGAGRSEELVLEYERRSGEDRWSVKARVRQPVEPLWPAFDILAGDVPVEGGDRRAFDLRTGRALVAPWTLPAGAQSGGPVPDGATQSLWIDVVSLLPLRWSIAVPANPDRGVPAVPDYGLSFTYDASPDLQPPDTRPAIECVG